MRIKVTRKIRFLIYSLILYLLMCFCSEQDNYHSIVMETFDIAKKHSINSNKIKWLAIEEEVSQLVKQLNSEKDLYNILQTIINRLQDRHSYLITANGERWQKRIIPGKVITKNYLPLDKLRRAKIAYIEVNPISSAIKQDMDTYAKKLYSTIVSSYRKDMTGWILDFRENTGGQLWPMLVGLSPLINSDTAGIAIYPNGNHWSWWAHHGRAGVGENIHYQLENTDEQYLEKKPIVILISNQTASSGEASVISFIGQDQIYLIGEPTQGLATVNQPFELSNGATLMLTTAYFGDRNKKIYPDGIKPHILVNNYIENEGVSDIQLNMAIELFENNELSINNNP